MPVRQTPRLLLVLVLSGATALLLPHTVSGKPPRRQSANESNANGLPASIYVAHAETPRRHIRRESAAASDAPSASGESNETFAYSEPAGAGAKNGSGGVEKEPYTGPKMVVKVGHIGAQGALPNEDKILNISRMQLIEEGILGADLDFEWV